MVKTIKLTDENVSALPYAKKKRYEIGDKKIPNFFVRVGIRSKVFIIRDRFGGSAAPARRSIGDFPKMSCDEARVIANEWNKQLDRGLDPKLEAEKAQKLVELEARQTFRAAMEDYVAWLPQRELNRHVKQDIAEIRRDVLNPARNPWLNKYVHEVTDIDVAILVESVRARAPSQAKSIFKLLSTFFKWATDPERKAGYGLHRNPIVELEPIRLGLKNKERTRTLGPSEICAYVRAAEETPYPYGPFFKCLLLSGAVRKTSLSGARWREFDFRACIWVIPEERVKHGQELHEHIVPMTNYFIAILKDIRQNQCFDEGDYVFSTTNGRTPINGFSRAMEIFKKRVQKHFQQIKPGAEMEPWVLHDTRRHVRTSMSALDVPSDVAELIIGHRRKGRKGVYDQYRFLPQSRRALVKYTRRLNEIVNGTAIDFGLDDLLENE